MTRANDARYARVISDPHHPPSSPTAFAARSAAPYRTTHSTCRRTPEPNRLPQPTCQQPATTRTGVATFGRHLSRPPTATTPTREKSRPQPSTRPKANHRTPFVRCHKHADPRPLKGPGLRSYYENQRFRSATSAANASRDTINFAPSGFLESRTPMPWGNWATSTQAPPFLELRDDLRHAALLRPMMFFFHDAAEQLRRLFHRQGHRFDRLVAEEPML